jgi:hypothetical protein
MILDDDSSIKAYKKHAYLEAGSGLESARRMKKVT